MTRGAWVIVTIWLTIMLGLFLGIVVAKIDAGLDTAGTKLGQGRVLPACGPGGLYSGGIETCSPSDPLATASLGRGYRPGAGRKTISAANVAACPCPALGLADNRNVGGCGVGGGIEVHPRDNRSIPVPAGQPPISSVRRFRVTAYCPCAKCCGKWADGITASGTRADHRLVAAPREFPFGTVMRIPGYGTVKVEDRGGAIKGDRLDVLFPTHSEALRWGVQWVDVELVGQ